MAPPDLSGLSLFELQDQLAQEKNAYPALRGAAKGASTRRQKNLQAEITRREEEAEEHRSSAPAGKGMDMDDTPPSTPAQVDDASSAGGTEMDVDLPPQSQHRVQSESNGGVSYDRGASDLKLIGNDAVTKIEMQDTIIRQQAEALAETQERLNMLQTLTDIRHQTDAAKRKKAAARTKSRTSQANDGDSEEDLKKQWDRDGSKRWFNQLTEEQRADWESKAAEALGEFWSASLRNPIHIKLRTMLRSVPEFSPYIVYQSAPLTRHLLCTKFRHTTCLYHYYISKDNKIKKEHAHYRINGVTGQRMVGNGANSQLQQSRDLFHCGCDEPTAVLDFILRKTIQLKGTVNGEVVTESVRGMILDPRQRLFMVSAILQLGHLTYDDFFDRDDAGIQKEPVSRELRMLKAQYGRIGARIEELEAEMST